MMRADFRRLIRAYRDLPPKVTCVITVDPGSAAAIAKIVTDYERHDRGQSGLKQ